MSTRRGTLPTRVPCVRGRPPCRVLLQAPFYLVAILFWTITAVLLGLVVFISMIVVVMSRSKLLGISFRVLWPLSYVQMVRSLTHTHTHNTPKSRLSIAHPATHPRVTPTSMLRPSSSLPIEREVCLSAPPPPPPPPPPQLCFKVGRWFWQEAVARVNEIDKVSYLRNASFALAVAINVLLLLSYGVTSPTSSLQEVGPPAK
jgi:hypothetical protein